MYKITRLLFVSLFIFPVLTATGQVKIGDNPIQIHPKALLELESSTQMLLLPRLTNEQRDQALPIADTPAGSVIFNTTSGMLEVLHLVESPTGREMIKTWTPMDISHTDMGESVPQNPKLGDTFYDTTYGNRIVVNGIRASQGGQNVGDLTGLTTGRIGADYGTSYFKGTIHDILIFNRALTDAEVSFIDGYFRRKYNRIPGGYTATELSAYGATDNLYTGDGSLAGDRNVTLGEHDLNFNVNTDATSGSLFNVFNQNTNGGSTIRATDYMFRLAREGVASEAYPNYADFGLKRYENNHVHARTQLDIRLNHTNATGFATVMSMRSDGRVGVGTDTPSGTLDVQGDLYVSDIDVRSSSTKLLAHGEDNQVVSRHLRGAVKDVNFESMHIRDHLLYHLKADDPSSLVMDADGRVSQWHAQDWTAGTTTGTLVQATSSRRPIYGVSNLGYQGLYFDGSDRLPIDLSQLNSTDYTIVAVVNRADNGGSDYIVGGGTGSDNQGLHFGYRANGVVTSAQYNNDVNVAIPNFDTNRRGVDIIIGRHDNIAYGTSVMVNGIRTSTGGRNGGDLTGLATGRIGADQGTKHFKGTIYDILIYNRALTDAEVNYIDGYFRRKYNKIPGGYTVAELSAYSDTENNQNLSLGTTTISRTTIEITDGTALSLQASGGLSFTNDGGALVLEVDESSDNLYTGDGSLAGDRNVTLGEHDLNFNVNTDTTSGSLFNVFNQNTNGGSTIRATDYMFRLAREGVTSEAYPNYADFGLKRYENDHVHARTQLDIRLNHTNATTFSTIMSIRSDGRVGIGTEAPTQRLEVSGNIAANEVRGTSDRRFKKNIQPITGALDKVKQLRGVYFNWRSDEFERFKDDTRQTLGFIAQEVEPIVPQLVHTDNTEEGYKSVNYANMVALLTEALKEQQKQIEQLQKEVEALKKSKE